MTYKGWEHFDPVAHATAQQTKPSKYRSVKTTVDGITFDSKHEAARYQELRLMEKAGLIRDLHVQQRFALDVGDTHIANYLADFTYDEWVLADGLWHPVVEDTKSPITRTPTYRLKAKLMKALHGITIRETIRPVRRKRAKQ